MLKIRYWSDREPEPNLNITDKYAKSHHRNDCVKFSRYYMKSQRVSKNSFDPNIIVIKK